MDSEVVGKRAQDVQTGLRDVADPLVSSIIPVTTQIGMAALLAVHIRGLDVIENIKGLYRVAANVGISGPALPGVLRLLSEAGWITVTPNVLSPKKIEESIPVFQELYRVLGTQWQAMAPGELEEATINLIEALSVGPEPKERVLARTGLTEADLVQIVEIGELGGYVRRYASPKEQQSILYTPLYMDEHPENLLNFLAKNSERYGDIRNVFEAAKRTPGLPVEDLAAQPVVTEMIDSNVVSAPAIDSSSGRHSFLFPQIRSEHDPRIVNKARVLLACVRYGERFSTITNVTDPAFLLSCLKERKVVGRRPHTNIGTQYQPAVDLGLGFIETHGERYTFKLYDTLDNIAAIDLAISMARGEPDGAARNLVSDADVRAAVSTEGSPAVVLPAANRHATHQVKKRRKLDQRSETARRLQAELMDDLRGVHRVT